MTVIIGRGAILPATQLIVIPHFVIKLSNTILVKIAAVLTALVKTVDNFPLSF